METRPDVPQSCAECHGTGIKPCRSAAEIHIRELGTFCTCGDGQLKWASVLHRLKTAEKQCRR